MTIILTFLVPRPFPFWPRFAWPLLGVFGVIAIVYSSLNDADTNARVLLNLFQEQFDPKKIRDKELRGDVEMALEYQRRIETQIRQQDEGVMQDRLEDTANQIADWLSNVYDLALRVDSYRSDDLLARERAQLPKELQQLNAQLKLESNETVRHQLGDVIEGKRRHWQALQALDDRMTQATLQMDQSLTALATIYSQIQLIDAQAVASGRAERLQEDIREQVAQLNDLVVSINEVYNYDTMGLG